MSAAKSFFDTNVLLYLYSSADPGKQQRARTLYREHALFGSILVSTQVVQEFYVAATRKLRLANPVARTLTEALLDLPLIIVSPAHIRSALDYERRYQISFWDALIVAAAEAGGAAVLYTEDLTNGQQYGSVLVRNPFMETP